MTSHITRCLEGCAVGQKLRHGNKDPGAFSLPHFPSGPRRSRVCYRRKRWGQIALTLCVEDYERGELRPSSLPPSVRACWVSSYRRPNNSGSSNGSDVMIVAERCLEGGSSGVGRMLSDASKPASSSLYLSPLTMLALFS